MMLREMLRARLWSTIPQARLYNKRRGNPELRQPLCNLVEPLCMSDPPPLGLPSRQSVWLPALGCAPSARTQTTAGTSSPWTYGGTRSLYIWSLFNCACTVVNRIRIPEWFCPVACLFYSVLHCIGSCKTKSTKSTNSLENSTEQAIMQIKCLFNRR